MSFSTDYISTSANRYSQCSDVAPDGSNLVIFGAGRGVAVWESADESKRGVKQVLGGHESEVVSVRFLPLCASAVNGPDDKPSTSLSAGTLPSSSSKGELRFISGDREGRLIFWRRASATAEWEQTSIQDHVHGGSVTAIAALSNLSSTGSSTNLAYLVLTAGSDCLVNVWQWDGFDAPKKAQTFETARKIPLALALARFPGSDVPILALSTTDRKVQIWPYESTTQQFVYALSMEGHLDWVRCLDWSSSTDSPVPDPVGASDPAELFLASGSQDAYVRLWSLTALASVSAAEADAESGPTAEAEGDAGDGGGLDEKLFEEFEKRLNGGVGGGGGDDDEGGIGQVSLKSFVITARNFDGSLGKYSLAFSALLQGHDTWVTSLRFSSPSPTAPLKLLSASADNSLILWAPHPSSSTEAPIWYPQDRFGQVSVKGLGFFGALWAGVDGAREVLASGWAGGWNVWREAADPAAPGGWKEVMGPTGHFDGVKSVAWGGKAGEWLISVSSDETTRIHAPWVRAGIQTWAEIARPQVHGYPLTSLAPLPGTHGFVSGADEKVVRVFGETRGFLESLVKLGAMAESEFVGDAPVGASVPPLGLSNKLVSTDEPEDAEEASQDVGFNYTRFSISQAMTEPPSENKLSTSTLWPEVEKLYGHGYELMAVAVSHSSNLLATTCKASTPQHAVVRLYDTTTWKSLEQTLAGHSLTVTRLAFSPDDRFLVSVGRDRSWRLYERLNGEQGFRPLAASPKPHARIIWDVAFSPIFPAASGEDDLLFATGSRDKSAKIWRRPTSTDATVWEPAATLKFDEGVTSLDFYGGLHEARLLLAVGLESGHIHLFTAPVSDPTQWTQVLVLDQSVAHLEAVTRLAFRPASASVAGIRLASGSDDRSVRVFNLTI